MQKGLVSRDTSPSAVVARNSSATLPKCQSLNLSWRRELNPRPSDYKSDALPTELRQPRKPIKTIIEAIELQASFRKPSKAIARP
jgi:hypothetical protein